MEIAQKVRDELQGLLGKNKVTGYRGSAVTTNITKATKFYPAQEDHQEYLDKNPGGYCNHGYRYCTAC